MNTITFHLEDGNNEEVNFNGETLTFTLQMIKTNFFLSLHTTMREFMFVYTYNYNIRNTYTYTSIYTKVYIKLYNYLYIYFSFVLHTIL